MNTKFFLIGGLVSLICMCSLHAQPPERKEEDKFSGVFILTLAKGQKLAEKSSLAKKYEVDINDGELTVTSFKEGKEKDGGTITLTIRDGLDVVKNAHVEPFGCLRIEKKVGGWANDDFVTRMDLNFKGQRKLDGTWVPRFNKTAIVEILWLDNLENGVRRYTDLMGIHAKAVYDVQVLVNPFNR